MKICVLCVLTMALVAGAEKGLCTKEESDAFCAKSAAALKSYLDKQVKEGVITPSERKALDQLGPHVPIDVRKKNDDHENKDDPRRDCGNLYEAVLDNGTSLSQYATAMRELSVELGTDFVDMNALTHDLLVEVGKDASANFFAVSAGVSGDYTHPIPAGADAFARLFIKNVKDRGLEVAALFT